MIDANVYLHQPERITIADSARVDWNVRINGGDGCVIGEHVHIATGCVINAGNGYVEMRDHSGCSNNVVIAAGYPALSFEHISAADPLEHQHPIRSATYIGYHVVIFANATILPGVSIGDYAIIGAGAVVTKDVPPYAIVMGVPGRIVGKRVKHANGALETVYYPKLRDLAAQRDINLVRQHYGEQMPEALAVDLINFVTELG